MQEFVVFAVAASMCVLCFAVGFIAALNLRMAERSAPSLSGAPSRNDDAVPLHANAVQPMVAQAPFVPVPAPVVPAPTISVPQAQRTLERQPDVTTRRVTQSPLPTRMDAVQPSGFPTPASPPAKVFLFGDPQVEPVVVPSVPPVPLASEPNRWTTAQHGAPHQLAPAQVELLPHRSPYARSGHRR